jgi:hypothetical protein
MKAFSIAAVVLLGLLAASAWSHPMMGAITWNRHVSRVVYAHCVSCHHDGGTAFPLVEYRQAREVASAIKDTVLARTMPPWGAVKGFGELRDDAAMSAAEIDLIVEWVDTGTPRGNNARALPEAPTHSLVEDAFVTPKDAIAISGDTVLARAASVAGLKPERVAPDASLQIVATLPDGGVQPLVWLYEYRREYTHAFWFAQALALPAGTTIRGVPDDARVLLIPAREQ